jgi:hypothetical protein
LATGTNSPSTITAHEVRVALVTMSLVVLTGSLTSAQPVHARVIFELPAVRLFPSERFTMADVADNMGRRMVMCMPESVECPASAQSLTVLDALHGFNFRPRRSIPSVGPTVFLIVLLGILAAGNPDGTPLGILNQVACDTSTSTLQSTVTGSAGRGQGMGVNALGGRWLQLADGSPQESVASTHWFGQGNPINDTAVQTQSGWRR